MRIKRVEIIALNAEGKVWRTFRVKAGKGKTFTSEGADAVLQSMIEKIEDANPNNKWRLVPIGSYRFKLVWPVEKPKPTQIGAMTVNSFTDASPVFEPKRGPDVYK